MLDHGHLVPAGDLGNLARHARYEAGLTQAEVAERLGVSQSAIAHAETGRSRGSLVQLQRRIITELGEFQCDGPFFLIREKSRRVKPEELWV